MDFYRAPGHQDAPKKQDISSEIEKLRKMTSFCIYGTIGLVLGYALMLFVVAVIFASF